MSRGDPALTASCQKYPNRFGDGQRHFTREDPFVPVPITSGRPLSASVLPFASMACSSIGGRPTREVGQRGRFFGTNCTGRCGDATAVEPDGALPERIRQTGLIRRERGHRKAMRTTDELPAQVPLFAGLSKRDLREISGLTTRLGLSQGRELTHQGERGHEFVIVLEGTVDVVIDGDVVATCNAGDYFGEIALLEDRPRTATVIAKTNVVVDVIGRREFSVLLNHHPDIDERLRAAMERRLTEDEALGGGATSDP